MIVLFTDFGLSGPYTGQVKAVLAGRDFVTPDDIREIARPALRHRIALAPELQIEGQDADQVLQALLAKVDAPRT